MSERHYENESKSQDIIKTALSLAVPCLIGLVSYLLISSVDLKTQSAVLLSKVATLESHDADHIKNIGGLTTQSSVIATKLETILTRLEIIEKKIDHRQ